MEKGECFVKVGTVNKKRKMTNKKRVLILTDTPRLFYVDPKDNTLKGTIELDKDTQVQLTNGVGKGFRVTVPGRTFKLEDTQDNNAMDWLEKIKNAILKVKKSTEKN